MDGEISVLLKAFTYSLLTKEQSENLSSLFADKNAFRPFHDTAKKCFLVDISIHNQYEM